MAEWEKATLRSPKPIKPGLPVFYVSTSTGEGITTQAETCPNKTIFMLVDELKGLFDSANQYRSGRGENVTESQQISVGSRVIIHCPGSKRDGKNGLFERFQKGATTLAVVVVDTETDYKMRYFECPVPGTELMWLEVV